jgi:hypothetical protein
MLFFWLSLLFLLAALDHSIRSGRVEVLVLNTRRQLFRLRNALRWEAINGGVDSNSWLFDYLDTSLTRSAQSLPKFTIYTHLGNAVGSRKEKVERQQSYVVLDKELGQPENSVYRSIQEKYQTSLKCYLADRHKIVFPLLRRRGFFDDKTDRHADSIPTLPTDPKVSTLAEYCHR